VKMKELLLKLENGLIMAESTFKLLQPYESYRKG